MGNVVKFPEAGPGIELATQAALWILGPRRGQSEQPVAHDTKEI